MSKIHGANMATVWKEHRISEGLFYLLFAPTDRDLVITEWISKEPFKIRKIRKALFEKIATKSFDVALNKTLK